MLDHCKRDADTMYSNVGAPPGRCKYATILCIFLSYHYYYFFPPLIYLLFFMLFYFLLIKKKRVKIFIFFTGEVRKDKICQWCVTRTTVYALEYYYLIVIFKVRSLILYNIFFFLNNNNGYYYLTGHIKYIVKQIDGYQVSYNIYTHNCSENHVDESSWWF